MERTAGVEYRLSVSARGEVLGGRLLTVSLVDQVACGSSD